jgi:hypothetical protein
MMPLLQLMQLLPQLFNFSLTRVQLLLQVLILPLKIDLLLLQLLPLQVQLLLLLLMPFLLLLQLLLNPSNVLLPAMKQL